MQYGFYNIKFILSKFKFQNFDLFHMYLAPDVKSVAQILATDANLLTGSNYLSLCGPLGVRYIDYAPYQQAVENGNMTRLGFFETMLLFWVTRCGDAATIEALIQVLLQAKYVSLAGREFNN